MEYKKNRLIILARLIALLVCLGLIVAGQARVGLPGVGVMLLGLAGILGILFQYNSSHR